MCAPFLIKPFTQSLSTIQVKKSFGDLSALIAKKAWEANENKHNETCNTLQPNAWGYNKADDGKHKNAEQVLALLQDVKSKDMNLLLITVPLPDGSIYPGDVKVVREVGQIWEQNQHR